MGGLSAGILPGKKTSYRRQPMNADQAAVFTGAGSVTFFSNLLRIRRTSTKMRPVSVQSKLLNISQSGSILAGSPSRKLFCAIPYSRLGLLNRTGRIREHVIGIRSDQPDRAYDKNQNYREHYGILGDILPFIFRPQSHQSIGHLILLSLRKTRVYIFSIALKGLYAEDMWIRRGHGREVEDFPQ
jgi:hypothetical protein